MSKKNNDIIYTAADIEKYHKGQLSAREMHALEKAALDDPLLADALEGYASGNAAIPADIVDLQDRLRKRTEEEKNKVIPISKSRSSFSWWKVAAMLVLIAGAGWIVFDFVFDKSNTDIAQTVQNEPAKKTVKDSLTTSTTVTAPKAEEDTSAVVSPQQKTEPERRYHTAPQTETITEAQAEQANADKTKSAPLSNEPVPGLATEKKQEVRDDEARSEELAAAKLREQQTRAQQGDIAARSAQPRKLQAAEEFYKVDRNVAFKSTNIFRGRVTDEYNNALPFSNITNTRDSVGTYADANGYFNLTSPDSVLYVQVNSIGFEPNTVELRNNIPSNRIKLEEDRNSLAEVVVSKKKANSIPSKNNNMVLADAEPADGWSNYDLYLANNLKEPENLKEKKTSGSFGEVELSFEVNQLGEPVNITVKKSLCDACDKEAIRLLKEGPKWKRKARKGKATVTITF